VNHQAVEEHVRTFYAAQVTNTFFAFFDFPHLCLPFYCFHHQSLLSQQPLLNLLWKRALKLVPWQLPDY
jgi:hypothetical protein